LQQDTEELPDRVKQNNKEKKSNKGKIRNPKSKNDTQQNDQEKQGGIHYMYFVF
jgi:hypothetical protein